MIRLLRAMGPIIFFTTAFIVAALLPNNNYQVQINSYLW